MIRKYKLHTETVIDKLKAVYYYCGSFTSIKELSILSVDSKLMLQSLSSGLIILSDLDNCSIINKKFRFCK